MAIELTDEQLKAVAPEMTRREFEAMVDKAEKSAAEHLKWFVAANTEAKGDKK